MKKILGNITLVLLLYVHASGQGNKVLENLKGQANIMGQAFISGDYRTFAKYTHPLIVRSIGGEIKMVDELNKMSSNLKNRGMSFGKITFDEPSKIVRSKNELQSTLSQHTEVKLADGNAISTSTLIAISTDNGNSWTFVDTSNKSIETIRKLLPNLNNSIIIPLQQPPVIHKN